MKENTLFTLLTKKRKMSRKYSMLSIFVSSFSPGGTCGYKFSQSSSKWGTCICWGWELRYMQITITQRSLSLSFPQIFLKNKVLVTCMHCMAYILCIVTYCQIHFHRSEILQQARQLWCSTFISIFKLPSEHYYESIIVKNRSRCCCLR